VDWIAAGIFEDASTIVANLAVKQVAVAGCSVAVSVKLDLDAGLGGCGDFRQDS